jgi:hypothetical protein
MPGYMPDSDPFVFFDLGSAKRALIEDLKYSEEYAESEESAEIFCSEAESVVHVGESYTSATMPDGLVYWINTDSIDDRLGALCEFLDCQPSELDESAENTYEHGREEYLVLTESEADEMAESYILDSVWAFRPDFLIHHMGLPYDAIPMLESFRRDKCESANDTFLAMLKDKESFVRDAISADGRGHFLNTYDGEENEQGEYLIYRIN